MTMTLEGKVAVEQFAARFAFSEEVTAAMQEDLAQSIEAAITEFKGGEYQQLIASTLRKALAQRIEAAITSWQRQFLSVPVQVEKDAA